MITATILELDTPNKNGRVYSKEVGEQIAHQIQERLRDGVLWGQLNGQDDPGCALDLSKVSHKTVGARVEGTSLVADMELVDTPCGKIARELLAHDTNIGFRPRGTGIVSQDGVISHYVLVSVDLVKDPA